MPELPEVETVRRGIEAQVVGRRIISQTSAAFCSSAWSSAAGASNAGRGLTAWKALNVG